MIVDGLGNPLALSLTGGQVHDIKEAEKLLALVEPGALLGDKGYDADSWTPPKTSGQISADLIHSVMSLRESGHDRSSAWTV